MEDLLVAEVLEDIEVVEQAEAMQDDLDQMHQELQEQEEVDHQGDIEEEVVLQVDLLGVPTKLEERDGLARLVTRDDIANKLSKKCKEIVKNL